MGTTELIVILAIVFLLFGASALPKLARSIGEAKREFEKASNEEDKATKVAEDKATKVAPEKKEI